MTHHWFSRWTVDVSLVRIGSNRSKRKIYRFRNARRTKIWRDREKTLRFPFLRSFTIVRRGDVLFFSFFKFDRFCSLSMNFIGSFKGRVKTSGTTSRRATSFFFDRWFPCLDSSRTFERKKKISCRCRRKVQKIHRLVRRSIGWLLNLSRSLADVHGSTTTFLASRWLVLSLGKTKFSSALESSTIL